MRRSSASTSRTKSRKTRGSTNSACSASSHFEWLQNPNRFERFTTLSLRLCRRSYDCASIIRRLKVCKFFVGGSSHLSRRHPISTETVEVSSVENRGDPPAVRGFLFDSKTQNSKSTTC